MDNKLYTWDQQIDEIHISFKTNSDKSNIKYTIKDRNINIVCNGTTIVEGVLSKRVNVGDEYWVKNADTIDFYLAKQKADWWECLIEGTEKVDVSALAENSNMDFSMLDPEARAMIEKMAHEHKQTPSFDGMPGMEENNEVEEIKESDTAEGVNENSE